MSAEVIDFQAEKAKREEVLVDPQVVSDVLGVVERFVESLHGRYKGDLITCYLQFGDLSERQVESLIGRVHKSVEGIEMKDWCLLSITSEPLQYGATDYVILIHFVRISPEELDADCRLTESKISPKVARKWLLDPARFLGVIFGTEDKDST